MIIIYCVYLITHAAPLLNFIYCVPECCTASVDSTTQMHVAHTCVKGNISSRPIAGFSVFLFRLGQLINSINDHQY